MWKEGSSLIYCECFFLIGVVRAMKKKRRDLIDQMEVASTHKVSGRELDQYFPVLEEEGIIDPDFAFLA